LAAAQQRLSELLLAADRDMPAIIEAADVVRRAERRVVAIERGGR
jgi:cob(I)alamin adenosyltransferase